MKKIATTLAFALPGLCSKPAGSAAPKRAFRLTLALLCVLLAASAAFTFRRITQEEIIQLLRQSALDGTAAYFTDADRSVYLSASLREVYALHAYKPLWSENGQPAPQLDSLLSALGRADQEGLVPATYHLARLAETLADIALHPDAEKVVRLDQLATAAYLTYAAHLSGGSMNPARLDTNWHLAAKHLPLAQYLAAALQAGTVGPSLAGLLPGADSGYPGLKRELQRLKAIARRGGWPALPVACVLQKNDSGQVVSILRQILAATGDLDSARVDLSRFDADLQAGLRRFQGRHGLTPWRNGSGR
jgi:murein L,D-transpeptidase YcbB/YkuD